MPIEILTNNLEGADVPQHITGTSSIGGFGEPSPSSFNRYKGIHEHYVSDQSGLSVYLREFYRATEKLDTQECTRVQHRALISNDLIREGVKDGQIWIDFVESIIPVNDQQSIIYLSKNAPSRQLHPSDNDKVQENLSVLEQISFRPYQKTIELVKEKGYSVSILNNEERTGSMLDDTVRQLYALYERFGWNEEDIRELCNNPNNTIGIVRHKGKIVSAGIAERAELVIDGQTISMVEITEAATDAEHINRGLYAAVSCNLLLDLANGENVPDVVFGECNTLSKGVLIVAKAQGRVSAKETMELFGIQRTGELNQQVPINDPSGTRASEYNNLMPMSLTKEQLLQNVQRV